MLSYATQKFIIVKEGCWQILSGHMPLSIACKFIQIARDKCSLHHVTHLDFKYEVIGWLDTGSVVITYSIYCIYSNIMCVQNTVII